MPIADWLPYSSPLYINIGFGLSSTRNNSLSVNNRVQIDDSPTGYPEDSHRKFERTEDL